MGELKWLWLELCRSGPSMTGIPLFSHRCHGGLEGWANTGILNDWPKETKWTSLLGSHKQVHRLNVSRNRISWRTGGVISTWLHFEASLFDLRVAMHALSFRRFFFCTVWVSGTWKMVSTMTLSITPLKIFFFPKCSYTLWLRTVTGVPHSHLAGTPIMPDSFL